MKTMLATFMVICLAVMGISYHATPMAVTPPSIFPDVKIDRPVRTAKIKRGNLSCTLKATGIVKPEKLVEVGAQVTGMIKSFGSDTADPNKPINYGSIVQKGAVLAQIDPTVYQAQVDQAEASLLMSNGNLLELQARSDQSEHDWLRAKNLLPAKAIAESDYDEIFTSFRVAKAHLAIAQAAIQQCEATLRIAKSNLNYTVIKSPIDGVIIDRRIDIGQTVVAAFNAPGLFLIADLQQMQVWASVNEEDIGQIHPGIPVRFTLNSFPDEVFQGEVAQIRLNATRNEKSANYTVVVDAKDAKGVLPYLTANVQFDIQNDSNVLLIPNDAFQWQPPKSQTVSEPPKAEQINTATHIGGDASPSRVNSQGTAKVAMHRKERKVNHRLWVKDGELYHPVDVQIGASDGVMTEVIGNNVKEGMDVILGEMLTKDGI